MVRFGEVELEKLVGVGRVDAHSARVWARAPVAGRYRLEIEHTNGSDMRSVEVVIGDERDHTAAWTYPDDFPGHERLDPCSRYQAQLFGPVDRGSSRIGTAEFQTAPEGPDAAPRRWTFGAMSCHQPFENDGTVRPGSEAMLRAAHRILREMDSRFLLMMGDQIYADYPPTMSLFDDHYWREHVGLDAPSLRQCTREQIRSIYQRRHRQFWGMPGFQKLQALLACYPMLDDHEVIDNFGSDPAHAGPAWDRVRHGALDAFFDYQASRVTPWPRPSDLDYGFTWGQAAVWVMDIRSHRRTEDGITLVYTDHQLEQLRQFLGAHSDLGLFVLVTTIPIAHIEGKLVRAAARLLPSGSDVHERWSYTSCIGHRDRLLRLLHGHAVRNPRQNILLMGGDVHTGAVTELEFEDGVIFRQLISSPISNFESKILARVYELAPHTLESMPPEGLPEATVRVVSGRSPEVDHNPYGGLNLGMVEVIDRGDEVAVALRLVGYRGDGEPVVKFESEELTRGR